eukprot:3641911-Amphidinium_carterae.2
MLQLVTEKAGRAALTSSLVGGLFMSLVAASADCGFQPHASAPSGMECHGRQSRIGSFIFTARICQCRA